MNATTFTAAVATEQIESPVTEATTDEQIQALATDAVAYILDGAEDGTITYAGQGSAQVAEVDAEAAVAECARLLSEKRDEL